MIVSAGAAAVTIGASDGSPGSFAGAAEGASEVDAEPVLAGLGSLRAQPPSTHTRTAITRVMRSTPNARAKTTVLAVGAAALGAVYSRSAGRKRNGWSASDAVSGRLGADSIFGGSGDDVLAGEDDEDSLWGGAGDDACYGDAGSDVLVPGSGTDSAHGGGGNDELVVLHICELEAGDVLDGGDG
ncbi:MAG TPA: hypothetical protein VFG69_01330, partial [Nannocystaceae bacterium]|nr:hypothetical protein [Nannocystaceae bacterium]